MPSKTLPVPPEISPSWSWLAVRLSQARFHTPELCFSLLWLNTSSCLQSKGVWTGKRWNPYYKMPLGSHTKQTLVTAGYKGTGCQTWWISTWHWAESFYLKSLPFGAARHHLPGSLHAMLQGSSVESSHPLHLTLWPVCWIFHLCGCLSDESVSHHSQRAASPNHEEHLIRKDGAYFLLQENDQLSPIAYQVLQERGVEHKKVDSKASVLLACFIRKHNNSIIF